MEKLHRITVDQVDGGLPQSRMNHSATVYVDIYLRDVASPAQWVAKGSCRALHAKLRLSPRTHNAFCAVPTSLLLYHFRKFYISFFWQVRCMLGTKHNCAKIR